MVDWQKPFWRDVQGKGKWGEEPWFTLKGMLYNLNIVNVGFASPPTVLSRWNSLEKVFNTCSHWKALDIMLIGADVCLLRRASITTQRASHRSWCHERTVLPHEPKEGQQQLFVPPVSSSAFLSSPALLASRAMTGTMEPKAISVWDVFGAEWQTGSAAGRRDVLVETNRNYLETQSPLGSFSWWLPPWGNVQGEFSEETHPPTLLGKLQFFQSNFSHREGLNSKTLLVWRPERWGETMFKLSFFSISNRKS